MDTGRTCLIYLGLDVNSLEEIRCGNVRSVLINESSWKHSAQNCHASPPSVGNGLILLKPYRQVTVIHFTGQEMFQHNFVPLRAESQHVLPQRNKDQRCQKKISQTTLSLLSCGEGTDEAPEDMWSPVSKTVFVFIT
jgi:hypothetical protein